MPIIYEIYHGGDTNIRAFTSKEQAIKAARAEIDAGAVEKGEGVEIEKITTPPLTLQLLLDIINSNGGSYVSARETVQTVTRGNRGAAKPKAAPEAPSPVTVRMRAADGGAQEIDYVAGRKIVLYPGSNRGRPIYAVGGVGFWRLDEARDYAKRGSANKAPVREIPPPPDEPPVGWIVTATDGAQIDVVAGRQVRRYLTREGRQVYAVGGVGFWRLDEARDYAKRGSE